MGHGTILDDFWMSDWNTDDVRTPEERARHNERARVFRMQYHSLIQNCPKCRATYRRALSKKLQIPRLLVQVILDMAYVPPHDYQELDFHIRTCHSNQLSVKDYFGKKRRLK